VLVVDDSEDNRDVLCRRLQRAGHDAASAEDGHVALSMLAEGGFDLVLLDVMMPGIDGFEVLGTLRETRPATELPVIMATARDQREDIVAALRAGANDYVTKPLDFPVVLARVNAQLSLKRAVDRIRALERDLDRRNAALEAANRRMRADLETAARVQQSLLPAAAPPAPGIGCCWSYEPCDELGGDILNVFALDDRHLGLYVLDVSGHGVPAALLSVTLSWLLSPTGQSSLVLHRRRDDGDGVEITPPGDVCRELSRRFQMGPTEQYFTLLYGVLDTRSRRLRYCSAGHPGPLLAPGSGEMKDLSAPSFPIGWMADFAYPEKTLEFAPGDRLYLYSDGVGEAKNAERTQFGCDRMFESLRATRERSLEQSVAGLIEAARAWCGGKFDDDVSLLAVEVQA
jgi:sigma-B regulation protein RsbU (phosphoserine phosphatase)